MNSTIIKHFFVGLSAAVAAILISLFADDFFQSADSAMLRQFYHVRGERPIDSSLTILYFSNEDISALGGLPLKRSYYALLVSALSDVGVRAIGFDISFPEPDREHPEYDDVFSSVVKNAGNVVLSGYFRNIGADEPGQENNIPGQFLYNLPEPRVIQHGNNFEKPFEGLLQTASIS